MVHIMIQQIKQSTVKCLHDTDGGDKKYKRKRLLNVKSTHQLSSPVQVIIAKVIVIFNYNPHHNYNYYNYN